MTGAASVIGGALLRRLWADKAWAGVRFLLGGRDPKALQGLCEEAGAAGMQADAWLMDLERTDSYPALLAQAQAGPVRGLALAAGINHDQSLLQLSSEEWDRVWSVDFAFHARLLSELKSLTPGATGLLIGSIVGHRGNAGQAAYAAAKGALLDLLPHAPKGLRLNILLPPLVESPLLAHLSSEARERLFQARLMPDPDPALSCAAAGAFLLGPASSYVHHQVFHADSRVSALSWD